MPITLRTGLPGHGKTLFALQEVEDLRRQTGRPVYYHGIPELTLPWTPIDEPDKWFELEEGAIIVIDEAQTVFRPRGSGAQVPEKVAKFETHRHRGHDVHLITQHPNLIDANIRRLVDAHVHVFRGWGLSSTTRYEWQECQNPQSRSARHDCTMKTSRRFPREVYGWYKSATLHTVQPRLPWKLIFFVVFCLAGMGYLGHRLYSSFAADGWRSKITAGGAAAGGLSKSGDQAAPSGPAARGVPGAAAVGVQELARLFAPVVPAIPASAPIYQEKWLAVQSIPIVQGCVADREHCQCYTQQGTRADVDERTCRALVERSAFDHTRPPAPAGAVAVAPAPVAAPAPSAPSASSAGAVDSRPVGSVAVRAERPRVELAHPL